MEITQRVAAAQGSVDAAVSYFVGVMQTHPHPNRVPLTTPCGALLGWLYEEDPSRLWISEDGSWGRDRHVSGCLDYEAYWEAELVRRPLQPNLYRTTFRSHTSGNPPEVNEHDAGFYGLLVEGGQNQPWTIQSMLVSLMIEQGVPVPR